MSNEPTSAENPWPVREVNSKVKAWIERLGSVWVEGQLAQVNMKPSWRFSYLTLRDVEAEMSLQVTCDTALLQNAPLPCAMVTAWWCTASQRFSRAGVHFRCERQRFARWAWANCWPALSAYASNWPVRGFSTPPANCSPLPSALHGLITGRGSAAERDVLSVAGRPLATCEVQGDQHGGAGRPGGSRGDCRP